MHGWKNIPIYTTDNVGHIRKKPYVYIHMAEAQPIHNTCRKKKSLSLYIYIESPMTHTYNEKRKKKKSITDRLIGIY